MNILRIKAQSDLVTEGSADLRYTVITIQKKKAKEALI